jgi:hypothetical protein
MSISREFNDYDYALVHLFEEYKEYYDFYAESIILGRTVILDNSLYELKQSFNVELYVEWISRLNPTYYIIPDDYEYTKNIDMFNSFILNYSSLKPRKIAVVHGSSIDELIGSYRYIDSKLDDDDMIAFSAGDSNIGIHRPMNIVNMYADGLINEKRKHHILGCILPQEYKIYSQLPFIWSGDTSSPVAAAIEGVRYSRNGMSTKPKTTIDSVFSRCLNIDSTILRHNIDMFRKFLNRDKNNEY